MHDSKYGNGEKLAELLSSEFKEGNEVKIGHLNKISPKEVAEEKPDVLILGGAIRKFQGAPATKKWLKTLEQELSSSHYKIPYGAAFLTHVMPTEIMQGYGKRYSAKFNQVSMIEHIYPILLTAQVNKIKGPFVDGVFTNASQFARNFIEWMKSQ
jgi:menaquinone-dependent protoporphyrinogen IX oxidase